MALSHDAWVKDGSVTEAPVTVSTPAPEAPAAHVETAPVVTETPAAAAPAAAPAPAAVADAAAAAGQTVQEFIEAQLDGKPFQIPRGVSLPWKRGKEQGFATVEELQRQGMFERDYRLKTAELATQRRQIETERKVEQARVQAQEAFLREQQEMAQKAMQSPEDQARYEAFIEQYRTNPMFKKAVDDAGKARMYEAEQAVYREEQGADALQTETQRVYETILSIGEKYPTVDPDRVRQLYSQALVAGTAELSPDAIEAVYKTEAQVADRLLSPLQAQMKALEAKLAAATATKAAETHNDKTRQAISRATAPVAAPTGGNPAAVTPRTTQLKSGTLADRSREWARQG